MAATGCDYSVLPSTASKTCWRRGAPSFCPLDADSSQLAAVLGAAHGESFVLQGPPGTGKSQTITNLITHCLASGKTVLFVSAKMAALEVVHRRLERVGMGPFCLELHSHSANKKAVLEQLSQALHAAGEPPPGVAVESKELDFDVGVVCLEELEALARVAALLEDERALHAGLLESSRPREQREELLACVELGADRDELRRRLERDYTEDLYRLDLPQLAQKLRVWGDPGRPERRRPAPPARRGAALGRPAGHPARAGSLPRATLGGPGRAAGLESLSRAAPSARPTPGGAAAGRARARRDRAGPAGASVPPCLRAGLGDPRVRGGTPAPVLRWRRARGDHRRVPRRGPHLLRARGCPGAQRARGGDASRSSPSP